MTGRISGTSSQPAPSGAVQQVTYHALQLAVNRPLSTGLLVKGQYTFSRARNYGDGADGDAILNYTTPSELERNWALTNFDRPHNVQMGFVYQLPWRTGEAASRKSQRTKPRRGKSGWFRSRGPATTTRPSSTAWAA